MNIKMTKRRLALADLNVSEAYQRFMVASRVRAIASNFVPEALGLLTVGERKDGTFWVVDGVQRRQALLRLGHTHALCNVFPSEGPAHEAKVFRLINQGRTNVSATRIFQALLTEGDEDAKTIADIVEGQGFELALNSGSCSHGWPQLACVAALQNIFNKGERGVYGNGGHELLHDTLGVIRLAWQGDKDAVRGSIVEGLAHFLFRVSWRDDVLDVVADKLHAVSPMAVFRYASDNQKLLGGSRVNAVAEAILRIVNKGRRKKFEFRDVA